MSGPHASGAAHGSGSRAASLSPHMEMYLKALLVLGEDGSPVRAKDLATRLGLSRPSVTKAVATLARLGYVAHQPYLHVALTPKGRQVGRDVLRRHQVLRAFLARVLGVGAEAADEDACALEHVVSRETLRRLTDFLAFLVQCPKAPVEAIRHFQEVAARSVAARSVAAGSTPPCCTECGLDRLLSPPLPDPETPVARQHTRF